MKPVLRFAFSAALVVAALPVSGVSQVNPLGAGPFEGSFSDGSVTLRLEKAGAGYEGVIEFDGQTLPALAESQAGTLAGTFEAGGQSFGFVAVREGGTLRFETGGTTYLLEAQDGGGAETSNPLARPAPDNPLAPGGGTQTPAARYQAAGGYSIALPAGWQPQEDGSGDLALIPPGGTFDPSGQNAEIYLLIRMPAMSSPTQPEAKLQLQQAFISPMSLPTARFHTETVGSMVVHDWQFQHPETGRPMGLKAFLTGGNGQVFALLGSGAPDLVAKRGANLRSIAASLQPSAGGASAAGAAQPSAQPGGPGFGGGQYDEPVPGQQAAGGGADGIQRHPLAPATPGRLSDDNPQSLQWLNHLRGKLLSRLSSYTSGTAGGYSSNERMLLYPNGQFEYYSSSSVSVQADGPAYSAGGSAGDQGVRRGTWRIVTGQGTSFLALVYEGSNQEEYSELDFRDDKTYLDGSRVFVTVPQ